MTPTAKELMRATEAEVGKLCRRYAVQRLRLFGSAVSAGFDPNRSDIDFLVEFGAPHGMGRFDQFFGLREELSRLLGKTVDLVDWGAARNPYFRKQAEAEAVEVYAA